MRNQWIYDDKETIEMIKERDKNDDGTRYTSEDVINIRNFGQVVSMVKCSCCRFDIYIHTNQDKVVCEHCNTVNDLRLKNIINEVK